MVTPGSSRNDWCLPAHSGGRLVFRDAAAMHSRAPARAVSQPALLSMLDHKYFHLDPYDASTEAVFESAATVDAKHLLFSVVESALR